MHQDGSQTVDVAEVEIRALKCMQCHELVEFLEETWQYAFKAHKKKTYYRYNNQVFNLMKTLHLMVRQLHNHAANLRGFRASVNPRFGGGIPDFIDGIPDLWKTYITKYNICGNFRLLPTQCR